MGSFTKVYARVFKPEDRLVLTWDAGYRNVEIYDEKRLVQSWEQSAQFVRGVSFQDEKLGKINVKFTDSRPLQLEVTVNGKKYKPTKKGKHVVDLTGPASVFWVMFAFTVIASLFIIGLATLPYGASGRLPTFITVTLIVVNSIYLFTSLMMTFKKYWAFFIGYAYMLLSTLFLLWNVTTIPFDVLGVIALIVRIIFVVYLSMSIRKVIYAIQTTGEGKQADLIDNKL